MAIVFAGSTARELATLDRRDARTRAIGSSWRGLPGAKVDKHSTGGVGDKISLAPGAAGARPAACYVPMMSGRALGHTGGTLDKLEAIPGFRTRADRRASSAGCCARAGFVLAGQTARLAPADRTLYALRDVTGTVESIPLIASSIMSKKLAEGIDGLVLDVKVGSGRVHEDAGPGRARAGPHAGRPRRRAGLHGARRSSPTWTSRSGAASATPVEVREAIDVLRGGGPPDTRALTVRLGAEMLVLGGGRATSATARAGSRPPSPSGAGLERLRLACACRGATSACIDDPGRLPRGRHSRHGARRAGRRGHPRRRAAPLGRAATLLGAGRLRKEDRIAPGAALMLHAKVGARVARGAPLCTIASDDPARARGGPGDRSRRVRRRAAARRRRARWCWRRSAGRGSLPPCPSRARSSATTIAAAARRSCCCTRSPSRAASGPASPTASPRTAG